MLRDDAFIPAVRALKRCLNGLHDQFRAFSRGIEDITGLTEADRADAEKNSVIGESGGEADVVR